MFMCAYERACVCMRAYVFVHTCVRVCLCVYGACLHVCKCVSMDVCMKMFANM